MIARTRRSPSSFAWYSPCFSLLRWILQDPDVEFVLSTPATLKPVQTTLEYVGLYGFVGRHSTVDNSYYKLRRTLLLKVVLYENYAA